MCAVNNGRGILVDERTYEDVTKSKTRHNVEFVPRGRLKLKGKDKFTAVFTPAFFVRTPVNTVHKLTAMRASLEKHFVGRERAQASLNALLASLAATHASESRVVAGCKGFQVRSTDIFSYD
jgi:hypothetical protein